MMKRLSTFCLFLWLPLISILATGDSVQYLRPIDTVLLSINPFDEKIFSHKMAPKQTLFSLAAFYGLKIDELYFYNPGLRNRPISVGEPVHIPIPNRAILRFRPQPYDPQLYAPVYYVVKKGDTMYRISKYFFKLPPEVIKQRNGLESDILSVGQLLHMGWMSVEGVPTDYRTVVGGPIAKRSETFRKIFMEQQHKKLLEQKGVACWEHTSEEQTDLYALHRSAPLNSIIQVSNPWMKRTIYVRVIGKIPPKVYSNEVIVVLSPSAARFLGAKDPRFFVNLHHYK